MSTVATYFYILSRMLANVNTCGVLSIICSTVCLIFCEISNCTSVSPCACLKLYIDVTLSQET